ncbi:MAG: ADP-ribosylation factor-like protein, partial [Candidatus Thermoplasmatota archaeon]|nr:ADP-ribosylation factor-like protein [Candidatus Thermoplasmatota archaeon]
MSTISKRKFCLLGEGAVGKTSLIRRFVTDQFDDRYITTIGTKVTKKSLDLPPGSGADRVEMMIWDIMGQQGYRTMLQESYFSGAAGALAICDVTRKDTLDT